MFDQQFGLPDPVFIKTSQTGSTTSLPNVDTSGNWEVEESLDVEWAHAIAPEAKILLAEANSPGLGDLLTAAGEAANYPGVVAVSMSWGVPEFSFETFFDSYLTTPAGHSPVTFVASAGDSGAPGLWPAFSPNVVAVGGTTLYLNANNTISSETAWSYNGNGGGGGVSAYEPLPSFQVGRVTPGSTTRNIPDVSYDANLSTGFAVYDSTTYHGSAGWIEVGGTSAGSPQVAAILAITDQGRSLNGLASLDGPSQTLPEIYALGSAGSSDFHDIISGANQLYTAGIGYDAVTGYGSIAANLFVSDLLNL